MKVILLKDIDKSKKAGSILKVKNGYAKNYLFFKEKAVLATKKNVLSLNKNNLKASNTNKIFKNIKKLNNISIIIPVRTKNNKIIYGSINTKSIIKILKSLNFKFSNTFINKNILIKEVGQYKIEIKNNKLDLPIILNIIIKSV